MLVIDGGGGTIELITYKKTHDAYVEACQSSCKFTLIRAKAFTYEILAASCGGNSLNESLRTIMEDRLGNHAPYLADPDLNKTIKSIVNLKTFES
jgi:hypothetical protein